MKLVAVVLAVGLWATGTVAQEHQHESSAVVKGSEHPEQIPDMVAYRHWYQSRSHRPDLEVAVQVTGLSDADQAQLVKALASFRVQWDAIESDWRTKLAKANGAAVDRTSDRQARLDLVNQTNKEVQALLSPEGWKQFQAYIQAFKRSMQMSAGVTQ